MLHNQRQFLLWGINKASPRGEVPRRGRRGEIRSLILDPYCLHITSQSARRLTAPLEGNQGRYTVIARRRPFGRRRGNLMAVGSRRYFPEIATSPSAPRNDNENTAPQFIHASAMGAIPAFSFEMVPTKFTRSAAWKPRSVCFLNLLHGNQLAVEDVSGILVIIGAGGQGDNPVLGSDLHI